MRDRSGRSGFSIIELLTALAIIAVAVAIVTPNVVGGLNRAGYYAAVLDFNRQLQQLRRQAIATETEIRIGGPGVRTPPGVADPGFVFRDIRLNTGWTYELQGEIRLGADGGCSGDGVSLRQTGAPRRALQFDPTACRLASAS